MPVGAVNPGSSAIHFSSSAPSVGRMSANRELTAEEERKVEDLAERDAEVRRHEQAHVAAGGQYVRGAAHYEYDPGPDGRQYAVGGEVSIDTSEVPDDPAATIRKADQVKRAALAPENPSGQDRRVAAEADRMRLQAQRELARQLAEGEGAAGAAAYASAATAVARTQATAFNLYA